MQLEFTFDECFPQIHFQRAPCLHAHIHSLFEEAIGTAAFALRAIERNVGVLQELFCLCAVMRRKGDTDASTDHHLMLLDDERRAQSLDNAGCK